ncbi:Mediator of RNA polymerase II transcription subunit 11 [Pseudozyma hubeiensis]|nr:Mediator of RNA polymerase II transcription subunit 11 [Pseudozyma hubeiensis]
MTSAPSAPQERGYDSLDVLPAELQDTIMEKKFAQIKQQRQDARNVLREAKQRTRNQQTDQQILLLMQADERLAALLAQAADSMRALLPPVAATDADAGAAATDNSSAQHGAKAFEDKAQQWFTILNEVQYSLRSAVRYLRQAQLSPLTPPVGPDARSTGRAGSAGRGHNLSLLEVFSDIGGLHGGTTFKLPPLDNSASSSSGPSSRSSSFSTALPESSLSLQALRERERNWKALSGSLQQIHQSMTDTSVDGTSKLSPELSLLESIRNGCSSDRILIDALVNTNNMA